MGQAEGSADGERQLIIEFGRRLREARRRAGLSQAEVAARLGIGQRYVSRVELGTENITLSACVRFAQAVGFCFRLSLCHQRPETATAVALNSRTICARRGGAPGSARRHSRRVSE